MFYCPRRRCNSSGELILEMAEKKNLKQLCLPKKHVKDVPFLPRK